MAQSLHRFPSTLDGSTHNSIIFTAYSRDGEPLTSIALYMPPNLSFGDGASYGNIDLGILGGQMPAGGFVGSGEGGSPKLNTQGITEAINQANAGTDSTLKSAVLSKAFSNFGLGGGVADRLTDLTLYAKGRAINPNSVLQYSNSEIRSFSFTFKMVAESVKDSVSIKDIISTFRKYMYAKKEGILLEYPAKWDITFLTPTGRENDYIPKIYTCFLESLGSNYNSSSNLTHHDGSPVEVDITLAFRETKALSRDEIEELDSRSGWNTDSTTSAF